MAFQFRPARYDLDERVSRRLKIGEILRLEETLGWLAGGEVPILHELELKIGDRGALQLDVVVAYRNSSGVGADVLVLNVDAADESDAPVDNGDLAVVAQVDLEAAFERVGLSDRADLYAGGTRALEEPGEVRVGRAEAIVQHAALDAISDSGRQPLEQRATRGVAPEYECLQVDR